MKTLDDFEAIIRDQFAEAETTIIPIIRNYNYGKILIDGFQFIQLAIREGRLIEIPDSVGTSLTTINDFLRIITDKKNKQTLEELTALLFSAQIEKIKSLEGGQECIQRSMEVMKITCKIKGYDFELLKQKLNLDSYVTRKFLPINLKSIGRYVWNGKKEDLKEVSDLLKSNGIIKKSICFKKMFDSKINQRLSISVSSEQLEFLVLLIDYFYKEGLVSVTGRNGHFTLLIYHLCDLDGESIQKEGKRIKAKVKRNKTTFHKLEKEINKIIRINCIESLRLLNDLRKGRK